MAPTYTLITGASEGIGALFAKEYAKKGRALILVARNEEKLEALKKEIQQEQPNAEVVVIGKQDLSQPGAGEKLFEACKAYKVSTLILNAGVAMGGLWSGQPLEKVHFLLHLNVVSLATLAHQFMPQLEEFANAHPRSETTEGGLMTVASTAAFQAIPFMAGYAASKAYVLHLTEAIHDEMKERCPNMRVSCLCPGPTDSTIWEKNGADIKSLKFGLLTVEQVVNDGIKGLEKGQAIVTPGWANWAQTIAGKMGPRSLARNVASKGMNQPHLAEMELSEEEKKQHGL